MFQGTKMTPIIRDIAYIANGITTPSYKNSDMYTQYLQHAYQQVAPLFSRSNENSWVEYQTEISLLSTLVATILTQEGVEDIAVNTSLAITACIHHHKKEVYRTLNQLNETLNSLMNLQQDSSMSFAPPTNLSTTNSYNATGGFSVEMTTITANEKILSQLFVLFIEIYREANESIAVFMDKSTSHQEAQKNLNKYSLAFSGLASALVNYPEYTTLGALFDAAMQSTDGTTFLHQDLHDDIVPLLDLLKADYGINNAGITDTEIVTRMDTLYTEINKSLTVVGATPIAGLPIGAVSATDTTQTTLADPDSIRRINEELESALVLSGELGQNDAKYLESLQANLATHMKTISQLLDTQTSALRYV